MNVGCLQFSANRSMFPQSVTWPPVPLPLGGGLEPGSTAP